MAAKRSKSNKALDWLVYALARVAILFVTMVRVRALYGFARGLGYLGYYLDARHRRLTRRQIRQSFPDWPERRVRRVAIQAMQSIVMLALETFIVSRRINLLSWRRHIRLKGMQRLLRMLVSEPGGTILLTGHYGNWEVAGFVLATLGFPAVVVARPLDNRYLDRYLRGLREQAGLRVVDKKGAVGPVDEVLDGGGAVCFVADQDAGRKGIFVDFLGHSASTFRAVALLALRHEVPVVVTYAKRLGDTFLFELGVARIIRPADWADRDDPVHWITQTYTEALAGVVRADPGQYFGWAHRRWKTQPGTRGCKLRKARPTSAAS